MAEEEEEERGAAPLPLPLPLPLPRNGEAAAAAHRPECPGCVFDRRKDDLLLRRAKPYREFLYIWIISLTAGTYPLPRAYAIRFSEMVVSLLALH